MCVNGIIAGDNMRLTQWGQLGAERRQFGGETDLLFKGNFKIKRQMEWKWNREGEEKDLKRRFEGDALRDVSLNLFLRNGELI